MALKYVTSACCAGIAVTKNQKKIKGNPGSRLIRLYSKDGAYFPQAHHSRLQPQSALFDLILST
jgi:hypothetical protein